MRKRYNFIHGTILNGLTIADTILESTGLTALPAVSGDDYVVALLDPTRQSGQDPEIVYIRNHTANSSTATIERGREGSTARGHNTGVQWVHGLVVEDINRTYNPDNHGAGSGLDADLLDGIDGSGYSRSLAIPQAVPLAVWVLNHNLGRFPGVSVVDSAGSLVVGDIQYNDSNTITITFSSAFSGVAHLD